MRCAGSPFVAGGGGGVERPETLISPNCAPRHARETLAASPSTRAVMLQKILGMPSSSRPVMMGSARFSKSTARKVPKIFEPFVTTKPKGEGTGLGLGIARKIVEKHGGEMRCESRPGRTVFEVRLPISPAPELVEHPEPSGRLAIPERSS